MARRLAVALGFAAVLAVGPAPAQTAYTLGDEIEQTLTMGRWEIYRFRLKAGDKVTVEITPAAGTPTLEVHLRQGHVTNGTLLLSKRERGAIVATSEDARANDEIFLGIHAVDSNAKVTFKAAVAGAKATPATRPGDANRAGDGIRAAGTGGSGPSLQQLLDKIDGLEKRVRELEAKVAKLERR